ncbi:MAG: branched-chain amino acid ABC transporter substrate-binding protein [Betaproteobacteria bacterium RBG_16_64_18]|nr:MAG: branched-chain amino acid ABC transporter substrate-binding protein [Betaproteobacteria bacterium RBG_16_64_18]OGA12289.1 MAG: branched-chain amino acid ABC transporter substrate-binding protein [Betaproteobacteria bacterium RIFCSPLOWO2_02_FULL_65_20]
MRLKTSTLFAAVALAAASGLAAAQTIKIGIMTTYSGPGAAQGDQLDKGFKLYLKLNGSKLPPGVKVEPIFRDDTGANPDAAKRLAQELIVREKVQFLTGFVWTPNAMAIAPLTAEAKVPYISANAAGVSLPRISPYVARVSFTLWQSSYPLGQWAAKKFKRAYTVVSDFAPGHEAEEAFTKGFKDGGGEIVGSARTPMTATDFIPYMQRVKDAKPEAIFAFNPAGKQATAQMKAYADLDLHKAGIKYIGTGDITTDEELQNMGDAALGVITVHHYSAAADRPANKAFVAAYKKEYGEKLNPGFMAVGAWDAMDLIFHVIREQKGKIDPDRTMQLIKNYKNPNSPRGPIQIDPDTRDIMQNEYLREVRKVGGQLANVELETVATQYKDPWKEFNKPK